MIRSWLYDYRINICCITWVKGNCWRLNATKIWQIGHSFCLSHAHYTIYIINACMYSVLIFHWDKHTDWSADMQRLLKAHQRNGLPLTFRSIKWCVCVSVSIWAQRGKQAMRTSRQTRERASEPKIKGAAHPNVTLYVNQTSIAGISNYWWEEKRQNDVVCLWPVQQPRQASWGLSSPCNKQFTQLKTWCHTHTHKSVARTWHTG